ncbi:hypothetical protein J2S00_002949 [Caldalkalibacillus uzonensis]|uniref:DinB-like domain-containing protein n=1 Tax=Caldalkalibacillus uzonensis TaxID=353224 RepID=A0ABU0CWB2_9BACI|nr:DinB family protein [Caldalkalibacillus uzonensis]MDQ0340144.1 hypothetical protein [Caldalkalibacillus uzonensis]
MDYRDEVLWNQLFDVRQYTLQIVENISESMIDIIPAGHHNSIRWNIGHIIYDQDVWFHHFMKDDMDVPGYYRHFFDFGTSPCTWKQEPPAWRELVEELRIQPHRLKKKFAGRLDEPLQTTTELGMGKLGEVIPRTLYHEWYHLGVIQSIKRFADSRPEDGVK